MKGAPDDWCKPFGFDGFEVSWVGPRPFEVPGFCFGSEDGRLLVTDEDGRVESQPDQASRTGEAVNGVASTLECFAVSTRADVTVMRPPPVPAPKVDGVVIGKGAHDVVATPSGRFVASLGPAGWLILRPTVGQCEVLQVGAAAESRLNVYRTVVVAEPDGTEVMVSAGRRGGVGISPLMSVDGPRPRNIRTANFNDLDVVDVCGISPLPGSLAVAAAGRDGTLILFRDALTDRKPEAMKFRMVEGIVYRTMSCRGHLIVITDDAVYLLVNLARDFLRSNRSPAAVTRSFVLPVVAVDANVYRDKYLLVLTADNVVLRVDVAAIAADVPPAMRDGQVLDFTPTTLDPVWEEGRVTPHSRQLVAG